MTVRNAGGRRLELLALRHEVARLGQLPPKLVGPRILGLGRKRTPAPADAYVYIGWPNDGAVLPSGRFKVWFGTRNFGVAPADTDVPDTGHHHLLIDTPLPPMDEAIPNDKHHLHFGLGQTETIIELPPGTHTLQLLMGDGHHIPHDPPVMSKRITIHVRAERGSETAGPTS